MSLYTASLNSGSNGNCYYVGNGKEAVLVDAGLSCREIVRRMGNLGLAMGQLQAIFITHEHIDHIKGLEVISARYQLPVYITPLTQQNGKLRLEPHLVRNFTAHVPVAVGGLHVLPFPKKHDAADPHSFLVSGNGVTIGVLTDIGSCCTNVAHHFSLCHAAYLEANYDEEMLENGPYPYHLKKRISGDHGHLGNRQALDLLLKHKSSALSHVFLSHLSKDNNNLELAAALFQAKAGNTQIMVASRYNETPVLQITATNPITPAAVVTKPKQLSLFPI